MELSVATGEYSESNRIFERLIDEPHRALYIKELRVSTAHTVWSPPEPDEVAEADRIIAKCRDGVARKSIDNILADEQGRIDPDFKEELLQSIAAGDLEPIVGFLCALAPNIVKLDILQEPCNRLLEYMLRSAKRQASFSNLQSVQIHDKVDSINYAFNLLRTCAQSPSLISLAGFGCNSIGTPKFLSPFASNVRSLTLRQCSIGEELLRHLIHHMPG